MYFTLRSEKVYVRLVQLSKRKRFVLTGVVMVVLWGLWGYCIYYKNNQRIIRCCEDIINLRMYSTRSTRFTREIDALQEKTETLHNLLQSHCDIFGGMSGAKMMLQSYLIDLIRVVKKSELTMLGCSIAAPLNKGWYTKQVLHFTVSGTLQSILHFCSYVRAMTKLVKCIQVRMDRSTGESFHIAFDFCVMLLDKKKSLQLETS